MRRRSTSLETVARRRRVPLHALLRDPSLWRRAPRPGRGMEAKAAATPAPGGGAGSVTAEETEKWMEDAMQMVRAAGGGRRGWDVSLAPFVTRAFEQTPGVCLLATGVSMAVTFSGVDSWLYCPEMVCSLTVL